MWTAQLERMACLKAPPSPTPFAQSPVTALESCSAATPGGGFCGAAVSRVLGGRVSAAPEAADPGLPQ